MIAEAAAVALGIAPGRDPARLPLARLPQFAGIDLRALAHDLDRPPCAPHAPFLAFDAEPRAGAQARAVIARLGLAGDVTVARGHVPEVPLPALAPGLLVSNPPWGLRLDAESAQHAWRGLGTLARERLAGWRLPLLAGQPGVTRHLGFKAERRWPVRVGGVDARWLIYTVRG